MEGGSNETSLEIITSIGDPHLTAASFSESGKIILFLGNSVAIQDLSNGETKNFEGQVELVETGGTLTRLVTNLTRLVANKEELQGHSGRILCAQLDAEEQQLVTGSEDNTIRIWNVRNCKCTKVLSRDCKVTWASFNLDATEIVSCNRYMIYVWNALSGQNICKIENPHYSTMCYFKDNGTIYTSPESFKEFDSKTGERKAISSYSICNPRFSPDSTKVFGNTGLSNFEPGPQSAMIIDRLRDEILLEFTEAKSSCYSPSGKYLAIIRETVAGNMLQIWNAESNSYRRIGNVYSDWIIVSRKSITKDQIAYYDHYSEKVRHWDGKHDVLFDKKYTYDSSQDANGVYVREQRWGDKRPNKYFMDFEEQAVIHWNSALNDLAYWDAEIRKFVRLPYEKYKPIYEINVSYNSKLCSWSFSKDDKWLLTLEDKTVQVLNMATGEFFAKIQHDGDQVSKALISPDGKMLMIIWERKKRKAKNPKYFVVIYKMPT
jgi:WD40 repeat protein